MPFSRFCSYRETPTKASPSPRPRQRGSAWPASMQCHVHYNAEPARPVYKRNRVPHPLSQLPDHGAAEISTSGFRAPHIAGFSSPRPHSRETRSSPWSGTSGAYLRKCGSDALPAVGSLRFPAPYTTHSCPSKSHPGQVKCRFPSCRTP